MALKLITPAGNKNAFKALIAAELNGVSIEVPEYQWGVTNKSEDFLQLNPIGKIPVLTTPYGAIFESNAIARYVARLSDKAGLYGETLLDIGQVEQWIDFASNELDTPLSRWGGPLHGYGPRIKEVEELAVTAAKRGLAALDTYLTHHTYLVGHHVTLADIITVCNLYNPIRGLLSAEFMAAYPHVTRYFFTLVNQPAFQKVMGEVVQCPKTPVDVLPASDRLGPASTPAPAAGAAAPVTVVTTTTTVETTDTLLIVPPAQAEKGKKEGKPKEKKAAAPSPPSADEEEDEAPKPKPEKSPLDSLPPSPMVMDAWKRLYSNTKGSVFREVAVKGFWEMYDPQGYSLWFCDYKYNEENTVSYVTLNKVSGFLQRMDLIRKHGFAKMCILSKDPFVIKGFWLFRGPDVPQQVKDECYDVELYEWTKVDISDPVQKELVGDMLEEPDVVAGLPLVEAKCFK